MSCKRGWQLFSRINNAIARRPVVWGLSLCAVEAMFADAFTQIVLEQREEFQFHRFKCFGIFNTFEGSIDYFMVNKFLPSIFPDHSIKAIIGKVIVYEIIFAPIYYFPIFYYVRQSLYDGQFSLQSFRKGMDHFRSNYKRDIPAHWSVWIPVATITFAFVPRHLALPWMVSCDLCWLLGLSFYRGNIRIRSQPESDKRLNP